MSQSLYRKHRPQLFSELVGQEPVATALRNSIREGRIGHAYLFSGPRGTGKTTSARLLAKALNCTGPEGAGRGPDGEPCNVCPSCTEITAGTSMDVLELDAASNRGVNEMRALLERVAYRSAGGARKVYIVDEVHMLTKEASTALLKTLEEPPEHVIFVLATTDPQMVLPTIVSRTQHFEFSLLPAEQLAAHLADVAGREGVEADADALAIIARRAAGSARDALSLLDQALAYGEGKLAVGQVRSLLGGTPFAARADIIDAVGAGDIPALLERLDDLLGSGVDARALADDLLRHLREVFLLSSAKGRVRVEAPEDDAARLRAQGEALGAGVIVRALEAIGAAAVEIRRAPDPRLVLEVALVRLARPEASGSAAAGSPELLERIAKLERTVDELRRALAGGPPPPAAPPPAAPLAEAAPAKAAAPAAPAGPRAALGALRARGPQPEGQPERLAPAASGVLSGPGARQEREEAPAAPAVSATGDPSLDDVAAAWGRALDALKPRMRAVAAEATPVRVEGGRVVLGLPGRLQQFHLPSLRADATTLAGALSAELGQPVRVEVVLDDNAPGPASPRGGGEFDDPGDEMPDPRPASDGGGVDSPLGLVIKTFGATVESETVRE